MDAHSANASPLPGNVYRGDMRFKNSAEAILRFPFPFDGDTYRSDVNIEPHDRTGATAAFRSFFDIDEHYHNEMAERAYVLAKDKSRSQVLPHMMEAQWEALEFMMKNLATDFPGWFSLRREGAFCTWNNKLLNINQSFVLGDAASLPNEPLEYICRQVQGDFILMDQREDNLWLDGGVVTEAYGWSFDFVLGMNWYEWHGPIRFEHENRVIDRALRMTMSIPVNAPQRRVNWVMTVKPQLDRSLEARPDWLTDDKSFSAQSLPDDLFVRTEFQQLYRLPRTNVVLFVLRHYLLPLRDVARVRKWRMRLHRVLRDLDPKLERFRGIPAREEAVAWLSQLDDGSPLSPGRAPDQDRLEPEP